MISAPEQFKNEETYVAGGGGACPVCGSNDFGGKPVEVDGSCAWQNVSCLDCGAEITDLYQLSGVDVNWSEARSCRYLSIKVLLEVDEDIASVGEQALLADALTAAGHKVVLTREPGGTPLAEDIRGLLLSNREEQVTDEAELLMMFAARSQHLENVIYPALEAGKVVVSSRFEMSTRAYQGSGRGMGMKLIEQLEEVVLRISALT